jgi:hypothetical protein
MHAMSILIALAIALAVGGCASEEKEWMKIGSSYTMAEFRRDYDACSKGVTLDENCMRSRGWVAVSPGKSDKPVVEQPQRQGTPTGIGPSTRQP